ncbi:MAG TPA: single-stranded DNA-binding protein [Candidatus Saccharimonadales bacterium]|nr:single-stranded DNA-binding protein [Candidatus Saccharimonadales bacterium]
MASFNKVILMGNLTRDPELRYTPKGMAIARFTLAVNRVWKTETGEQKEEVAFIDVDAWGRSGETIAQYLKKGRPLLVEGRLKQDTWEDKQTGKKQSKLMVTLESFKFVDSGQRAEGGPSGGFEGAPRRATTPVASAAAPAQPEPPADEPPMPSDDDVPF